MSDDLTTHIEAADGDMVHVGEAADGSYRVRLVVESPPAAPSPGFRTAWLEPDQARAVAAALNHWADEIDAAS